MRRFIRHWATHGKQGNVSVAESVGRRNKQLLCARGRILPWRVPVWAFAFGADARQLRLSLAILVLTTGKPDMPTAFAAVAPDFDLLHTS